MNGRGDCEKSARRFTVQSGFTAKHNDLAGFASSPGGKMNWELFAPQTSRAVRRDMLCMSCFARGIGTCKEATSLR